MAAAENNNTREAISIPGAAVGPYSPGLRIGNRLYVSGQIPLDFASGQLVDSDIKAAANQSMQNIGLVLEQAGFAWTDVVKCTILLTDMDDFAAVNEVYAQWVKEPLPARAAFAVKALPKGAMVEIEAIAEKL